MNKYIFDTFLTFSSVFSAQRTQLDPLWPSAFVLNQAHLYLLTSNAAWCTK